MVSFFTGGWYQFSSWLKKFFAGFLVVDKAIEISNLDLVKDLAKMIDFSEQIN